MVCIYILRKTSRARYKLFEIITRNKITDKCHQRYRRTRTEDAGSPGCGSQTQLIEPPISQCPGHDDHEGDDGGLDGGESELMYGVKRQVLRSKLFNPYKDQDHCIVLVAINPVHYYSS